MRALLAAAAAVLITASATQAQETTTIGKQVPDVTFKLDDKEEFHLFRALRGKIAVFYFWRSTNLESLERLSQLTDLYRNWKDKGVCFVSVTTDKKEKAQEAMEERNFELFRYSFFGGQGGHYHLGAFSEPYVVLIDPRGILAWRGRPDDRLEERLADLHARTDPPAGNPDWLGRRFRKAERFYDQGEYGRAFTIALQLSHLTDEAQTMHEKAQALMAKCEGGAENKLKEALQAEQDGDLEQAARMVAQIAVRFEDPEEEEEERGQPGRGEREESIKHKAEFEIGRMNGNRELKKLIRDARKNAEGELLLDQAADLEEDDLYVEAKRIYMHVADDEDFEDTKATETAELAYQRLMHDKSIRQKMAEARAREEAWRLLDLGDRFAAIELYDEAREHYDRVVADHADTTAADRARQRLTKLPKPEEKKTADAGS